MTRRKKGKAHVPAKSGPDVFHDYGSGKGRKIPLMQDGKVIGGVRLNDVPPVRDVLDDYCDGPPKGDAA